MPDDLVGRDKIEATSANFDPVAQKMKERAEEAAREAALEQAAMDAAVEAIRAGRGGNISIGNSSVSISGSSVGGSVAGRSLNGGNVSTTSGMTADEFVKAFSAIYDKVKALPADVQEDVKDAVDTIQQAAKAEATNGEAPDEKAVKSAANEIAVSAPSLLNDVADVALATLENPAKGVLTIIRKVLEKAKQSGASVV